MKFRQFEFRLFPRVKSKKKKKQKNSISGHLNNAMVEENIIFDERYSNYCDSGSCLSSNPSLKNASHLQTWSPRGHFAYSVHALFSELTIKTYCHSCVSSTLSTHSACVQKPVILQSFTESLDIGTPNTIPKTRSRIKTNPWLPSPKATTKDSSSESFAFAARSPSISSTGSFIGQLYRGRCSSQGLQISLNVYKEPATDLISRKTNKCVVSDNSQKTFSSNCVIQECNKTSNLNTHNRISSNESLIFDTNDAWSRSSSPVCEKIDLAGNLHCAINFQYEEQVNDLLDNHVLPRDETFLSIKDLMEEEDCNPSVEIWDQTKESYDKNKDSYTQYYNSSRKNSEINTFSSTLNEDLSFADMAFYNECCMLESTDTGYASLTMDSECCSNDDFESFQNELEWDDEDQCVGNLQYSSMDWAYSTDFHIELDSTLCTTVVDDLKIRPSAEEKLNLRTRSRSLADIELSLDDKVKQLQEEKMFVQQKIREAQEEEYIRREQLVLFHKHGDSEKREILLHTLRHLRDRLENQATRLQISYDTVLAIQKRFSKRRLTLPIVETRL